VLGAVHEIAHPIAPEARVAYIDCDPLTVELARLLLAKERRTMVVEADLIDPDGLLSDPRINDFLDLGEPVAVLVLAALHHIQEDDAADAVAAAFREWTVSGSYLAISHLCDAERTSSVGVLTELFGEAGIAITPRDQMQIHRLLRGWQLVPPGLAWTASWRPDADMYPDLHARPHRAGLLAGLARKPVRADAGG
jgi:hypothetical protein